MSALRSVIRNQDLPDSLLHFGFREGEKEEKRKSAEREIEEREGKREEKERGEVTRKGTITDLRGQEK